MSSPQTIPQDTLPSGDPLELQRQLTIAASENPYLGHIPKDGDEVKAMFDFWLAPNVFVCQMGCDPCSSYCGHAERRCGSGYWRNHSAIVAAMMRAMAEMQGASPEKCEIWHAAGLLHDLDYLRAPHDLVGHDDHESHPIPLVVTLQGLNYPPVLILAILEHSPHLDLGTSSSMSAALIACDEAATLCAFGDDVGKIEGVPQCVIDAIPERREKPSAEGRRRQNIKERMLANFQKANSSSMEFVVQA